MTPERRDTHIVAAWCDRPDRNRSNDDVLAFYGWLLVHKPKLVPPGPESFEQVLALVVPYVSGPRGGDARPRTNRDGSQSL